MRSSSDRQESELKILINTKEIVNPKSTNFLGVVIDNNLSWEVCVGRSCSRISHNLFVINILS
jgi:hypothetical protein